MHASNKSDRAKTTEAGGRRAVLRAGLAGSVRWKGHREAAGSGGRRDARGQRGIIFCSSTKEGSRASLRTGPTICAVQWNMSSSIGAAEHDAGGSFVKSESSLLIRLLAVIAGVWFARVLSKIAGIQQLARPEGHTFGRRPAATRGPFSDSGPRAGARTARKTEKRGTRVFESSPLFILGSFSIPKLHNRVAAIHGEATKPSPIKGGQGWRTRTRTSSRELVLVR